MKKIIFLLAILSLFFTFKIHSARAQDNWCNADPRGTRYGNPCSPLGGPPECGGDGKKIQCGFESNPTDSVWYAAGGCCEKPTPQPTSPVCPVDAAKNCAIYECPDGCQIYDSPNHPECRTFVRYADCSTLTADSVSNCGQIDYLNVSTNKNAWCGVLPGSQCRNGKKACQGVNPSVSPTKKPKKTPTKAPKPSKTPTPAVVPSVKCDLVTINKTGGSAGPDIRVGDSLEFQAIGTSTGAPIKSIRLIVKISGKVKLDVLVPAVPVGGQYIATYSNYIADKIGNYKISTEVLTQ